MATEDIPTTSSYAPKSPDLSSLYPAGPTTPASHLSSTTASAAAAASCSYSLATSLPGACSAQLPGCGPRSDETTVQGYAISVPGGSFASSAGRPEEIWIPYGSSSSASQPPHLPSPRPQQRPSPSQTGAYGFQPSNVFHIQHAQPHPQQQQKHYLAHPPPPNVAHFLSPPIADHNKPQAHNQQPPTATPTQKLATDMPPRRTANAPPLPPVIEPSPVKTKFPTARIKRIMQADEEVGKVAQQTPIAVGKALELFMIQLVSRSADVAKEKGSKRVSAPMLKQVVEADDQWDFLRDIVSRVENEKEGLRAKKADSESDDEVVESKRRGRGGGRRKKTA